jgi:hypothetical protein
MMGFKEEEEEEEEEALEGIEKSFSILCSV